MAKINLADVVGFQTRKLAALAEALHSVGVEIPGVDADVSALLKKLVDCLQDPIDKIGKVLAAIEAAKASKAEAPATPKAEAPAASASRKALTRMIRLPSERVTVTQEVFDGDRAIARLWATQASQGLPVMMCIYDREALKEAYRSGSFVLPESVHSYFLMSPSR